jgi:hypothetical protein
LKNGYTPKLRPSGHDISDKFQIDHGGAIPPNLLALANTESNGRYQRYCRNNNFQEHPARFPKGIPSFFIKMLTNPGDLVFDPFAGSCVTGEVCEQLNRRWICCEIVEGYVKGAKGRFIGQQNLTSEFPKSSRIDPYIIYPPNSLELDESLNILTGDGGNYRLGSTMKTEGKYRKYQGDLYDITNLPSDLFFNEETNRIRRRRDVA